MNADHNHPTHPSDIDDLNADLARRLQTQDAPATATRTVPLPPPPPHAASPGPRKPSRNWAPIAGAALLCLLLGLGGGWLLFGRGNDAPAVTIEGSAETDAASTPGDRSDDADRDLDDLDNLDETLTLEDLFEQLPLDQLSPGESPLDGTQFGDLRLDDLMSPEDLDQLEAMLENLPSADELDNLFAELDGENLNELLDPERLDEMNQMLEEMFGS